MSFPRSRKRLLFEDPCRRLTHAFLDFDAQDLRRVMALLLQAFQQPFADVLREEFGGRVLDRQENAVAVWKEPLPLATSDSDLLRFYLNSDVSVPRSQQHMMVEFIRDRLGEPFQRNEIEQIVVFIQVAFDFHRSAIVVAVQPLALVAFVADEVSAAEYELIFRDPDVIAFHVTCFARVGSV
jgi:hypothetical protein